MVALHKMQVGGLPAPAHRGGSPMAPIIDMLSLRDLLFDEIDERKGEIEDLRRYIQGS